MKRLAVSALAALFVTAPLATTALTSTPASAIVLPSGMTLRGRVEPANAATSVKNVSISAQDGETDMASLSASGGKTFSSFHFKLVGPGTVA